MRRVTLMIMALACQAVAMQASDFAYHKEGRMSVAWNKSDVVGIYTVAGSRIRTTVYGLDSADPHNVQLTGSGWELMANVHYYAYSPYNTNYILDGNEITSLPITYSGQSQTVNGDLSHLPAYDYMMTEFTTTESSADFSFSHLGSVVRYAYIVPSVTTFRYVELSADRPIFTAEAVMNLPGQTVVPTSTDTKARLSLQGITLNAGDTLVAYFMVAPATADGDTITVRLADASGRSVKSQFVAPNIVAGKLYNMAVGIKDSAEGGSDLEDGDSQPAKTAAGVPNEITSSLKYPCATQVDFLADVNDFEYVEPEPVSTATGRVGEAATAPQGRTFTIDGRQTAAPRKGQIFIQDNIKIIK